MTRDEVLAMAEQAGAVTYSPPPMRAVRGLSFEFDQLERFAAIVAENERKAAEQDRVDAERYRYLRNSEEGIEFRDGDGKWRADCLSGPELDETIDRARSAK